MSRRTQDTASSIKFSCTGLSPSMTGLPRTFPLTFMNTLCSPTTPNHPKAIRFGLFPLRSPLLRESLIDFFSSGYLDGSVPQVSLYIPMYSVCNNRHLVYWVTPFGNPRINKCLLLPEAYRSLPRPSSPDGSKASTMDP